MNKTEIRLLQATYLPPGQAPLPPGTIVNIEAAHAAELVASGGLTMDIVNFSDTVLAASLDAFGEAVTYQPAGLPDVVVRAIFTGASKEVRFQGGEPILDELPTLGCRIDDFAQRPAENELFIIRGLTYAVARVHDDSLGHLKLFLHGPI